MTNLKPALIDAAQHLKNNRQQMIDQLAAGQEHRFLQRNAKLLDDYFQESFEASTIGPRINMIKNPYAIIALGGYGRQEQCVHSDVDLLFLFERQVPKQAEDLIREIVYPLWDIGMEVGHATRSVSECIAMAKSDFEILTSLLDARFVCGQSKLYMALNDKVRDKILARRSEKVIKWLVQTNLERHERFGDSAYLLEPNLKEGKGGLRDYHTMRWIARIKTNAMWCRDLEYQGYLSNNDYDSFKHSLDFIWSIRNHLHLLSGRKCDQLHFEFQTKLADALGYVSSDGQQPVERFLGELHGNMEFLKHQHMMFLYEQGHESNRKRRRKKTIQKSRIDGLMIKNGMLAFVAPEAILESPALLISLFEESARLKLPISSEAVRLVSEFGFLIDDDLRRTPAVVNSFERILLTPATTFNVLNQMRNTGLLVRLVPDLDMIIDRIQYDEYHLYPVDKHSLRVVMTITQFSTAQDLTRDQFCGDLYQETRFKKQLLWAALLHDVGKGVPGNGHSEVGAKIAYKILIELGQKKAFAEMVEFLVREHLLLIKTATRRDINDEETAIACARRIGDTDRLILLYLLTVADSIATGPKAWNEWAASLLRGFFLKVMRILEQGELASQEAVRQVDAKKAQVLASDGLPLSQADFKDLFKVMSPRYLLYTKAPEMIAHGALYNRLGSDNFVWQIDSTDDPDTRCLTICAKDKPGLFSKIAGTLTLNSLDILDVQVFTWRNNIALDIFRVKTPPDRLFEKERWDRAHASLKKSLNGELDLADALQKKLATVRPSKVRPFKKDSRVEVDNSSSSFFTIIEVFTDDRPGLLFFLTDALFACGLDIWVAKIATKVDHVVDVFYVRDFDGQKADGEDQVAAIETAIAGVLPDLQRQTTERMAAAGGK